jgi:PPOX class probable F420-dependent enzyme
MSRADDDSDFRGLAGQLVEIPFPTDDVPAKIGKKLKHDRYAWLTTVAPNGMPAPMLVWFHFDGAQLTVYSRPRAPRVRHLFENPAASLHLESDGMGGALIIIGGRAAVTAEAVDPRDDHAYWGKYHVEAAALGLKDGIATYSARITINPATLSTTYDT